MTKIDFEFPKISLLISFKLVGFSIIYLFAIMPHRSASILQIPLILLPKPSSKIPQRRTDWNLAPSPRSSSSYHVRRFSARRCNFHFSPSVRVFVYGNMKPASIKKINELGKVNENRKNEAFYYSVESFVRKPGFRWNRAVMLLYGPQFLEYRL